MEEQAEERIHRTDAVSIIWLFSGQTIAHARTYILNHDFPVWFSEKLKLSAERGDHSLSESELSP